MQRAAQRTWTTAGITLAGLGVITIAPVAPPPAAASAFGVRLTADTQDITLDLVRHGQSTDDVNNILGTLPPGAPLTELGQQQAEDVAKAIQQEYPGGIAGIYASELIRTQQTADALASLPGMPGVTVLSDLNEIPAGLFEGHPRDLLTEASFFLPMASWILGGVLVAEPGTSYNGVVFDDQVDSAVNTIYNNTIAGNGPMTDVAYASGGDIAIWVLMNVKNPDVWPIIESVLANGGPPPNGGQAILDGNPTDGWTLVSWDGTPVSATPDLFTGLFVDFRNVIVAPQVAAWHIWEALQGGDSVAITAAMQTGFTDVLNAFEAFPQSVIDTITGAMGDAGAGDAVGDLVGVI